MKNILYILIILAQFACEEVIELDLPLKERRLVVDGLITNHDSPCYVNLSYTSKYDFKYYTESGELIEDAVVILMDDFGNTDTLTMLNPGKYVDQDRRVVQEIGRTYTLKIITAQDEIWMSEPESMLPVPLIDSLYFERDKTDISEYNPKHYKFFIYVDWKDSVDYKNYYLRRTNFNWGGEWQTNVAWNWVFTDKYIDGNYLTKNKLMEAYGGVPFYVNLNQYSLTENAYKFWKLVHEQTMASSNDVVNSGVPLFGNVYNVNNKAQYALGYFQVSALSSDTVYIDQ